MKWAMNYLENHLWGHTKNKNLHSTFTDNNFFPSHFFFYNALLEITDEKWMITMMIMTMLLITGLWVSLKNEEGAEAT